MSSATRAWDLAFYSLPFKQGELVLTATAEYASISCLSPGGGPTRCHGRGYSQR